MYSHDYSGSDFVRADMESISSQGVADPVIDLTILMDDDDQDTILINKDDDPVRLSMDFIQKHKLPTSAVKTVVNTIKDNIQFLNKSHSRLTPTRQLSLRKFDSDNKIN